MNMTVAEMRSKEGLDEAVPPKIKKDRRAIQEPQFVGLLVPESQFIESQPEGSAVLESLPLSPS